jgi:hypothetical protein
MAGFRIAEMICAPPPPPPPVVAAPAPDPVPDVTGPAAFAPMVLHCDGRRPLRLRARLLLEAATQDAGLGLWSEIAVLEAEAGGFVAVLHHRRHPRGMADWHDARLCPDPEAVRGFFRRHDPLSVTPVEMLIGSADDATVPAALLDAAAREARLLRAEWGALLGAVFGEA